MLTFARMTHQVLRHSSLTKGQLVLIAHQKTCRKYTQRYMTSKLYKNTFFRHFVSLKTRLDKINKRKTFIFEMYE